MTVNIKALILVGGFGTRMRPLTLTTPKPLLKFCNKKMLLSTIEKLQKVGIRDIILAVSREWRNLDIAVEGMNIHMSIEEEPLGTAGPLSLARNLLDSGPFFVLNSDIIGEFPFIEMFKAHQSNRTLGTILVKKMNDYSNYGVIIRDGKFVSNFCEKPSKLETTSAEVNAGVYIFEPEILEMIPLEKCSLERVIFPKLVRIQQLCAFELQSYWMDIGTPERYLIGQQIVLSNEKKNYISDVELTKKGIKIISSSIGENVKVGGGVLIVNSAIFDNTSIGDYCVIKNTIVGTNCILKNWSRVSDTVLGDFVTINEAVCISKCKILPNKNISDDSVDQVIL